MLQDVLFQKMKSYFLVTSSDFFQKFFNEFSKKKYEINFLISKDSNVKTRNHFDKIKLVLKLLIPEN